MAVEAFRLFQLSIYRAVRENQSLVCEVTRDHFDRNEGGDRLDAILLPKVEDRKHYRNALVRLFPRLDSIWGNTIHGGSRLDKDRRIASTQHFQTYFRMSMDPDAVSSAGLGKVLNNASETDLVSATLKAAVSHSQRDGSTRAKAWLEALIAHGDEIPLEAAEPFLRGVFAVADELNVDADQAKGWSIGDNLLRMHWLLPRS